MNRSLNPLSPHRHRGKARRAIDFLWKRGLVLALSLSVGSQAQVILPADIDLFGDSATLEKRAMEANRQPGDKTTGPYQQTLIFGDGRELRGELAEINKDEIVWHRDDASEPLRFPRNEVRRIRTGPVSDQFNQPFVAFPGIRVAGKTGTAQAKKPIPATLKLPGGDWLFGEVMSLDGESFQVKLDADTQLAVERGQIEWMHFALHASPAFGFSGSALDMEGWTPASATMEVAEKTLTIQDAPWLGRSIAPPQRFEVAFELPEDAEEGTRLWLQPFGPQPNCYGTGTAEFRFGKKEISKLLFVNQFDHKPTPLPKEALEDKGPAKYRVFYDGAEKRFIVLRNGRLIGDWKYFEKKDDQPDAGNQNQNFQFNGICFDRMDNGQSPGPLKFNRLRFQPWNGKLPKEGEASEDQDEFSTEGTEPIRGRLESIVEKDLSFSGKSQAEQINTFVRFAGPPPAPLADAEAKLELGRRGEFSARHVEIHDGKLHCETTFSNSLELPLSAINQIAFPIHPPQAAAATDMLVFKNGDELPGKALSASLPGTVRWRTNAGQELEFQSTRIAGLRLASTETKKAAAEEAASTVELHTGERFRGKLLGLDDKQLRLEHPLLGPVTFARNGIWRLFPNVHLGVVDGGVQPTEWMRNFSQEQLPDNRKRSTNSNRWIFLDGTYILRSDGNVNSFNSADMPGLGQVIDPTLDRFEVRIEAAYLFQAPPSFLLNLRSKKGDSLNATLSYSDLQVSVMSSGQNRQSRWRDIPLNEKLGNQNQGRDVRLFVDTRKGTCDIVINDVLVTRLGDAADERLAPGEYTLQVQPYPNQGIPSRFSNLWIGPWNGDLLLNAKEDGGSTELANGDVVPGVPKFMQDGKLKIDCDLGELELPTGKALAVHFGGNAEKQPAAARFRFGDGTVVNVDSFHWDGQALKAHSALLGNLELPANAVTELIFNPSPPKPPAPVVRKKREQKDSENGSNPLILQ